jgi:hypothetical protein
MGDALVECVEYQAAAGIETVDRAEIMPQSKGNCRKFQTAFAAAVVAHRVVSGIIRMECCQCILQTANGFSRKRLVFLHGMPLEIILRFQGVCHLISANLWYHKPLARTTNGEAIAFGAQGVVLVRLWIFSKILTDFYRSPTEHLFFFWLLTFIFFGGRLSVEEQNS